MLRYRIDLAEKPGVLLHTAQELVTVNRAQGFAALNDLFRAGRMPDPAPEGRYAGTLLALELAPGLTQFFRWLAVQWMPWRGKTFHPSRERGDNIFTNDSYFLARLFNPFYRGFLPDHAGSYRAFAFRTYSAPGVFDPDRMVLKIDYNLNENPAPTIRRVLDELVELDEDLYLGKAHVRWWWQPKDRWQTVAFFSLTPEKLLPSS